MENNQNISHQVRLIVAEALNLSPEEIANTTTENSKQVFGI